MYKLQRYLLMTLDPVHVGTGGYRLGRVDMSIVREPGTRLPKIPGTSLSGAIRSYAAYTYGRPQCAGQKGHCGRPTCPICYTFGHATDQESGWQGTVNIFDGGILLFPVHSMAGPVWVSTKDRLQSADFSVNGAVPESAAVSTTMEWGNKPLNLGWLLLDVKGTTKVCPPSKAKGLSEGEGWKAVEKRLVLVSDRLFSQIVNSNLEVRTSVSIDPETGAAESGALFTYEAIPRATWLLHDAVSDARRGDFPSPQQLEKWHSLMESGDGKAQKHLLHRWRLLSESNDRELSEAKEMAAHWIHEALELYDKAEVAWDSPLDVITAGLNLAEHLGVGGMGTRGFGRIRKVADWPVVEGGDK